MEVSVFVKSPSWDNETQEKWLKFREWVKQNGGKWEECRECHKKCRKITFTLKEQENHQ